MRDAHQGVHNHGVRGERGPAQLRQQVLEQEEAKREGGGDAGSGGDQREERKEDIRAHHGGSEVPAFERLRPQVCFTCRKKVVYV